MASISPEMCVGNPDVNVQLQAAIEFTKTDQFKVLFDNISNTEQWKSYRKYFNDVFKIKVEEFIQRADVNDTLATVTGRILRSMPLAVKIRLFFAPTTFNIDTANALYESLNDLSEIRTIREELCCLNVNLDDIFSKLLQ